MPYLSGAAMDAWEADMRAKRAQWLKDHPNGEPPTPIRVSRQWHAGNPGIGLSIEYPRRGAIVMPTESLRFDPKKAPHALHAHARQIFGVHDGIETVLVYDDPHFDPSAE